MPTSWLNLTTHRLDIYDEKLAKTQFLEQFEILFNNNNSESLAINELPTAYDYIRLGHPLSCLLEWGVGNLHNLKTENGIKNSFITPVLSILIVNSLDNKKTQIIYKGELPIFLDIVLHIFFALSLIKEISDIITPMEVPFSFHNKIKFPNYLIPNIDFFVNLLYTKYFIGEWWAK